MSMHIFNKIIVFFFLISIFSSCQKDDIVYDINQLQSSSYNANKNKLKSVSQYISIVYANLFQKALSSNELVEITRCIESIGDKQVAHEIVLSNFMLTRSFKPSKNIFTYSAFAFTHFSLIYCTFGNSRFVAFASSSILHFVIK